jgi:hypothetical protein
MKYWRLKWFPEGNEDEAEYDEFLHTTEEAAQREACFLIIERSFSDLEPSECDEDCRQDVLKFLQTVDLGGYSQALEIWSQMKSDYSWDEDFEIDDDELLEATDVPLLDAVAKEQHRWDLDEEAEDEEEDEKSPGPQEATS